jgi:serine phosphatase RsbU (regulator of sigma subunit)/anti-sigma regulatory factor (Ser/Thr protein kinase)
MATLQVFIAIVVLSAWLLAVEIADRERVRARLQAEQSARARVESLYELEHAAAHQLQRALLPRVALEFPGVRAAVRYRPAEKHHDIGGDWYDIFELSNGRIGFSVGDVVGHDLNSAAAMGRLQSVLRVVAGSSDGPSQVLEQLDLAAEAIPGAEFATVGYGEYSPSTGLLRYACAGHPPPLVVTPRQATYLSAGRSRPLAIAGGPRPQDEVMLAPGSTLLWYSDGLVEDRREPIDVGLGQLARVAGQVAAVTPDGWCEAVMANMTRDRPVTDDIVLICLQLERTARQQGPLSIRLTSPGELATARRSLRSWVRQEGIDSVVLESLLLVCSEALSNALEHAYRDMAPGPVDLWVESPDADHLRIRVTDQGRWLHDREGQDRGRGLLLINRIAASTTLDRSPHGTTITIKLPMSGYPPAARLSQSGPSS